MSDILKALFFGKDDAESDITSGGLLAQSFLETYAYKAALDGRKFLIIGRKGSGKSAICLRILREHSAEYRASLVTPDEISAEEVRRFELQGITPEQSKFVIWRYAFCVSIAKRLLASVRASGDESAPEELARLRKFLIDNGEIDDLSFGEKFWKIVEKIKASLSLEAFGVKVGAEVETKPSGLRASDQLDTIEQHLNLAVQKTAAFTSKLPYYLLIDQIERVWSNDRSSDQLVIGLLLAAKHFRRFPYIRCIVSLRTDIYEFLQFGDRDKFRGDELRIDWTKPQILNLMLCRAQASAGKGVSEKKLFGMVFPTVVAELPTADFLVQRTLMRPRDIIQLANACRDAAEKNGHDRITVGDVQEAATLYSAWKLSDLLNEWRVNYPFLNDLLLLFSSASYSSTRDTTAARFGLIRDTLINRYPPFASTFSLEGVLSILYSIGFLGVVRNGNTIYAYDTFGSVEPSDCAFVVHPGFRDALKCTSAVEVSPYDPLEFGEQLAARFQRETFAIRGLHEQVRGSRGTRSAQLVYRELEKLTDALTRSRIIPVDPREEVMQSVRAIIADLARLGDSDAEGASVIGLAMNAGRYLHAVNEKLATKAWLDKDVEYALYESIRAIGFLRDGVLAEYR